MIRRLPVVALLIAVALAACGRKAEAPAAPQPGQHLAAVPPPAGQAWGDVAATTPEGGVRMGNPDAPVAFVEYASLTCPHCRDFTKEAADPLVAKYVSTGKVSWEYRPFLLNSLDTAAFLLARCRGPAPFFKLAEQAYAAQEDWVGRFMKLSDADRQQLSALPPAAMIARIAATSGLDGFFRARGLPAGQASRCLADAGAAQALADGTQTAVDKLGVSGTPTFFINGKLEDTLHTWAQVDARLAGLTG